MKKQRFIIWAPAKEQFNFKGESLGMDTERAVYRAKGNLDVSKDRRYRSGYPTSDKNLTIVTFRSEASAQEECDWLNKAHKDHFIVKQIL